MELWVIGIVCALVLLYGLKCLKERWPSQQKVRKMIQESLPTQLRGNVVELGTGWKSTASSLAIYFPEATITSYSTSPLPCLLAWIKQRFRPLPNLTVSWQDFFIPSLDHAQAVICYLYPGSMSRLKEKLEKELAPGTFIVSYLCAIPGWQPIRILELDDIYHSKIYVYQKGG